MKYELNHGSIPANSELRDIISKLSEKRQNITFQSSWIQLFLQLFKDKSHLFYFIKEFQEFYDSEEANPQNVANSSSNENKIDFQKANNQFLSMNVEQINYPTLDNSTQELFDLSNQIFTIMDRQLTDIKQEEVQQQSIIKQDPKVSYLQWSQIIQSLIEANPFLSEEKIYSQLLKIDYQDAPKPNIITKMLLMKDYHRIKLGRIPIERNSMRNIENRYKFGFKLYNILKNEGIIYFIDCYQFDINFVPEYKWIRRDNKIIYKLQDEYLSLYVALSSQGKFLYHIKHQKNDTNSTIQQFLYNLNDQVKVEKQYQQYFVSEGSLIHSLAAFCRDNCLKLLQLPPLSPQCSPLYYLFEDLRMVIRSKRQDLKNLQQLKGLLEHFCSQIKPQDYCSKIGRSIIDALTKKMF